MPVYADADLAGGTLNFTFYETVNVYYKYMHLNIVMQLEVVAVAVHVSPHVTDT